MPFVFGINAVSFLVSAWLIGRTPGRFNDEHRADPEHAGIQAGFRYAMSDRVLRSILIGWSVLILGAGLILVAELPYADSFGQGAFGYGLLNALWAGGAALGAVLAGALAHRAAGATDPPVRGPRSVVSSCSGSDGLPSGSSRSRSVIGEGICEGFASVAEQGSSSDGRPTTSGAASSERSRRPR